MKQLLKTKTLNKLFWVLIYITPLIIWAIGYIHHTPILANILNELGIYENNIIITSIQNIFGENGVLHLLKNNAGIIYYLSYFIIMNIIHIIVDLILILPRTAQSFNDKINNSGDNEL